MDAQVSDFYPGFDIPRRQARAVGKGLRIVLIQNSLRIPLEGGNPGPVHA